MMRAASLCAAIALGFAPSVESATVRDARVRVEFSPGGCDVAARFVVDTAEPVVVDHHLLMSGEVAPRFALVGAIPGETTVVGRTARLRVSLTGSGRNEYSVRYSVNLPAAARDRCPLLVPAAPTDGISRAVHLEVAVPAGANRLPGAFPAFAWDGLHGAVIISHMPSFVRVPHVAAGTAVSWRDRLDVGRIVDVAAVAIIGVSTIAWITLRRRQV